MYLTPSILSLCKKCAALTHVICICSALGSLLAILLLFCCSIINTDSQVSTARRRTQTTTMTLREENPQGFSILIVCAVFTLLATIGVALRFRSRMIMRQRLVLSDYSIICALVLAYGNMVVMGICTFFKHYASSSSIEVWF